MMTKPLQEKLIQHSLLDDDIIVEDVSSGTTAASSGSSNICIEYICNFIHLLSNVIFYCSPLITIMSVYYNFKIASFVGFGLFVFKVLVLDLFLFKMGKIQNWPKKVSEKNKSMLFFLRQYKIMILALQCWDIAMRAVSHPCHNQCDSIHSDDERTHRLYTCIYIYIRINEVRPTQSVNERVRVTK
jgi:hypothetical protein